MILFLIIFLSLIYFLILIIYFIIFTIEIQYESQSILHIFPLTPTLTKNITILQKNLIII